MRAALFALLLVALPADAALVSQSFQWARNFDGTLDGAYPSGGKPPIIEDLTWDLSNALQAAGFEDMRVGTPFSFNVCPYLLGTERANAALTIVTVSGDDPASEGMAIQANCAGDDIALLTHSALQTGSGSIRLNAAGASGSVLSGIKPWAVTSGVPGQVTGVQCTTVSTTEIDCTCTAVSGATSYNAIRVGAATVSGLTSCAYNFTGLTASTTYTLSFSATNASGTGTASATVSATTGSNPSNNFNPAYPRLASRPHGAFEVGNSQATLLAESAIVAEFNLVVMSGGRQSTWGTNTTLQTLPGVIKSFNNTGNIRIVKYHNAQQQNIDVPSEQWIIDKLEGEDGGSGNDDWFMTSASHTNAHTITNCPTPEYANHYKGGAGQSKTCQLRINPTLKTTPDANGYRWPQWFARSWWYQDGDDEPGKVDDWLDPNVSKRGKGLRGGQWDGVFSDDQYLYKNHGDYSGIDYDSNGVADLTSTDTVKMWVGEGHQALRDAWKSLAGDDWIFMGNTLHMMAPTETIPTAFEGTYDAVFVQDITKLYETRPDGWDKMMDAYRRGFLLAKGPEIVFFHSNIQDWEDKANAATQSDPPGNLSNARWNRYGLASALMDNGYYGLMITDGPPELDQFDEFYGGTSWTVANMGWLGYPTQTPRTTPYSQGVYVRLFDNGYAAVNPRGNGTRTITLPAAPSGCHWDNLGGVGAQDPTWNDGAHNVTQLVSMPEREGRLGKKHCP